MTDEPIRYSGKWFRQLSDDDLHAILDGAMADGMAYRGTIQEIARREANRDKRQQLFWIKITFAVSLIGTIAAIIALFR